MPGAEKDEELIYLWNYLEKLYSYDDVRELNKTKFKLNELYSKHA